MKTWNNSNIDMYDDIMEFHKTFCPDQINLYPSFPSKKIKELRMRLINEEVNNELIPALEDDNLTEIADAIYDSIVVLLGTAIAYGIPKAVWTEIHKSNMAKLQEDGTVKIREDGKILKPEGWKAPDIERILRQARLKYADS
jgi:predicted HAD superfamily Cof-like phosphohydrolase